MKVLRVTARSCGAQPAEKYFGKLVQSTKHSFRDVLVPTSNSALAGVGFDS